MPAARKSAAVGRQWSVHNFPRARIQAACSRQWGVREPPHRPRDIKDERLPRQHSRSEQGDVKLWINTVRKAVKNAHPSLHPTNPHTIFKAPDNISQSCEAAYEPSVVSIGPLHHCPSGLQNCKWRFLRCLLSRCGNGNDASRILDDCLMELKALDVEVRSCYSENLHHIDPYSLATSMLLDGCFIIYLLLRRQEEGDTCSPIITSPGRLRTPDGSAEQGTQNIMGKEEVSIVKKVDKVQESMTKEQVKGKRKVVVEPEQEPELKLELDSDSDSDSDSDTVDLEIGDNGREHFDGSLLGNLWTWNLIVYDLLKLGNQIPFFVIRLIYDKLFKTPSDDPENVDQLTNLALNLFSDIHPKKSIQFETMPQNNIHHLLHLFHSSIVTHRQASQPVAPAAVHEAGITPEWIPNATELAMAGVKFMRKEKFDSFLDVSFENGVLEIPLIRIYDYTNSLFRNLIAFEQCYPNTNTDITIYANFMDCMIDTADDARLLYMKGILMNRLSTDEEVASLFNQLCNQVHYDPNKNYLNKLFAEVTKYHHSKWHQWRAGLVRDYFSNPWVIISVVAAAMLLLLTIEQSFFTAFSYFRPPNP